MAVRVAQLVIVFAIVVTTSHQSLAAVTCTAGAGCFKKGTRPHIVRQYYNYAPHYNYAPRAKQRGDGPHDDPQVKAIWEEAIGQ
jgi:hypothetical protein